VTEAEERVAESIRAFNDADWVALERMWDPAGEIVPPRGWPEGGVRKGWDEIRAQFETLKADWSEDHVAVVSIEEIRTGVVLTAMRWAGTGAGSGLGFDQPMWMVGTVRLDGRIAKTEYFLDEAEARACAER
jgi:ketosteroid isomerase-like protein